ncbi:MAG: peptide chain release factor-like protein [Myxococcales bacterium]|nr:peptide chain release factor-like protein [Myxococcales bacterium]
MSDETKKWPTDRETLERETELEFLKASGPGGQHRNKRETAVRLTHSPSGVVVVASERRSQHQNRELAMDRLADKLRERNRRKKRRKATLVPKRSKRKRLESKRRRSEVKAARKSPTDY